MHGNRGRGKAARRGKYKRVRICETKKRGGGRRKMERVREKSKKEKMKRKGTTEKEKSVISAVNVE